MKIRRTHTSKAASIDWTSISHGTRFMKFTAKDDDSLREVTVNGVGFSSVEIHGLVDENGTFYILEEIVEPQPTTEGTKEDE